MTILRALVELERLSGLPEDRAVNNWYWDTITSVGGTDMDTITAALEAFYQAIDNTWMSNANSGAWSISYYDLDDPTPRVPLRVDTPANLTMSPSASPGENAVVLSFQGSEVSGVPQARRRGRVYLGPMGLGAFTVQSAGAVRVAPGLITALAAAAGDLLVQTGVVWIVYSPTTRGAGPAQDGAVPITNGWIDNAPDTIRSRGAGPTARTLFP